MHLISRRRFLRTQLFLGIGALLSPALVPPAAATTRLNKFMQLSDSLLAPLQLPLDKRVGARLLVALNNGDQGFSRRVAATQNGAELAASALAGPAIAAWFRGVVGDQLVTYEKALKYRVVADVMPVRTYCRARPGFWGEPPEGSH